MDGIEDLDELFDAEIEIPAEFEPQLVDTLPKGYLSPSQCSSYLKCPRSWALSYIDKVPRKAVARMFQGTFVHSAVEVVLKEKLRTGKLPPQDVATDAFSDAFDASKRFIEDWEEETEGSMKDVGVKCTTSYYQGAAQTATPIEVEKTFTKIITSPDGKIRLPILGRIDSIQIQTNTEQEYQDVREGLGTKPLNKLKRIHDLKVCSDKWTSSKLENDLQFTIYAGAEQTPDVQVDQVVKGRGKVPRPRYEKLEGVVTSRQVAHVEEVAMGVARSITHGINTGYFPMTDPANWWCREKFCGVWRHCRGAAVPPK